MDLRYGGVGEEQNSKLVSDCTFAKFTSVFRTRSGVFFLEGNADRLLTFFDKPSVLSVRSLTRQTLQSFCPALVCPGCLRFDLALVNSDCYCRGYNPPPPHTHTLTHTHPAQKCFDLVTSDCHCPGCLQLSLPSQPQIVLVVVFPVCPGSLRLSLSWLRQIVRPTSLLSW